LNLWATSVFIFPSRISLPTDLSSSESVRTVVSFISTNSSLSPMLLLTDCCVLSKPLNALVYGGIAFTAWEGGRSPTESMFNVWVRSERLFWNSKSLGDLSGLISLSKSV
jgi:hypothetical protein